MFFFVWDGGTCITKFSAKGQREPLWRSFVSRVAGRCMYIDEVAVNVLSYK